MTTFKRYLAYRLKSRIGYTATVSVLGFLITLISLIEEHDGNVTQNTDSLFFIPATILSIVAVMSTILEFMPFLNRRNLDTLYTMPIHRRTMHLVHYLSGLSSTLFCHTVSFFLVFFFWLPHREYFALGYAIPLYFISIVCGIVMYAIAVFLFSQGNTLVDGCLTLGLCGFSMPLCFTAVDGMYNFLKHLGFDPSTFTFFWSPINEYTTVYQKLIECDTYLGMLNNTPHYLTLSEFFGSTDTIIMTILFLLLGIGAVFGFFFSYCRKRIETVGEITTSFFSYRTMIPLYAFALLTILGIDAITVCILLLCMVIGYIIYRRTYRLKKSDFIVMGIFILYAVVNGIFG